MRRPTTTALRPWAGHGAIFAALPTEPELTHFIPLVAYTGARAHELLAARWADIDPGRQVWAIPAEHAKAGVKHEVPLSPGVLRVIERIRAAQAAKPSPWLFPAPTGPCDVCRQAGHADRPNKALRRLSVAIGMLKAESTNGKTPRVRWVGELVRPHDIRRTVSNSMRNDLRVPPCVVDFGVLAHAPPRLHGTYMPGVNLPEVRRALDRWSDHLDALLNGERADAKVVPMRA